MSIPDFIARCDRYCADAKRSRVWLSKKLFDDTNRLDVLAGGKSDVGVMRLERAARDLTALEEALRASPANDTTAAEDKAA